MLTENVSAHGARVFMERKFEPGQQVLVSSPKEGVRSQARIVYCQRVAGGRFALALELTAWAEPWAKANWVQKPRALNTLPNRKNPSLNFTPFLLALPASP